MKRLFMMCGMPFAGKTTLAQRAAEHLDAARVSLDEINVERGLPDGGTGLPVEQWERTRRIALARLDALMTSGRDLILDDTCCFRWLRDGYREVANRHGYTVTVIFVDIPHRELQRRRAAEQTRRRRASMKDEVFDAVARTFEQPGEDEDTLVFGEADDIEDWVRANLH